MLHILMNDLGVTAERTLMVGDTTHDLQLAKNAGAQSIGVTYGAHTRDKLERLSPLVCVENFSELLQWLSQNG
jgi:phosphoglycolate phosphatase